MGGTRTPRTIPPPQKKKLRVRLYLSDVVEVPTKSDEERARHDVAERLSARQQLACGERGERRGVEQVEFQADGVGELERALGVARHVVPDARVRHVDRAEEVRRGGAAPPQRPQERVEPTLVLYSAQRTRPLSLGVLLLLQFA